MRGYPIWLLFGGVIVVMLIVFAANRLTEMGVFTQVDSQFDGKCTQVYGVAGAEDVEIDRTTGIAYISAQDRRTARGGGPQANNVAGGLYALDLRDLSFRLIPLTPDATPEFRPHGLSLYTDAEGRKSIFVINHPLSGGHKVEVFDLSSPLELAHRETIEHPLLISPNDLVAAGPNAFYATNDHANSGGWARAYEDVLKQDRANVVYVEGAQARIVADRLTYPNGINMSANGEEVYTTESTDGRLRIYARDPATGDLTLKDAVYLGVGLDNVDVGPDGALWVARHVRLLKFLSHASDEETKSPSQIIKVTLKPGGGVAETVYLDDGHQVSGASVAAVWDQTMVIGPVFQSKLLVCALPESESTASAP